MPETQTSAYPEILPVIEQYLKTAKESGQPMRIHFWDMDHYSAEPAKVIADPGLNALAKKFGSPLYILENVNSDLANIDVNNYINGNTYHIKDLNRHNPRNKAILDIYEQARQDKANNSETKTQVYYPEARKEDIIEAISYLPANQKLIMEKFIDYANQEISTRMSNRTYTNSQKEMMDDIPEAARAKLSPTENAILDDAFNTMRERGLDALGNEKIAQNTNRVFDPKRDVQIMMYGALHYERESDLNEAMPGLSIGLLAAKDIKENAERYINKKGSTDFPNYVYYTDEHRLVKMDNDAAKAEFLGMDDKQFQAWKLSHEIKPPEIKLPSREAAQPISGFSPGNYNFAQVTPTNITATRII